MFQLITLAWRSTWRRFRRTLITVLAIGTSVSFAIFFIALADGMYDKIIDSIIRMQSGHITIEHVNYRESLAVDLVINNTDTLKKELMRMREIDKTWALVSGQGIVSSGSGTVGALIVGVEPSVEKRVSPIVQKLNSGSYLSDGDVRFAVIGEEMAKRLKVVVGSKIVFTTNDRDGQLVEEMARIKGIFNTGSVEIDGHLVQISINFARKLFRLQKGESTQLAVLLHDIADLDSANDKIGAKIAKIPNLVALPWQKILVDLASFMKVDKGSNLVFQGIILFLMLFTIFNTILMSVLERKHEFALMLAVGASPLRLKLQVLIESAFLSIIGALVGCIIGGGLAYWVQEVGFDMGVFMESDIDVAGFIFDPVIYASVSFKLLATISLGVVLVTILISLLPLRHIDRIKIADVLR